MNVFDLGRRLSPRALRRLATRYRRQLIGGSTLAAMAVSSILLAVPALAHDGKTATPLADCVTTGTLTTPCAAPVTPTPAAGVADYTVVLPGIGTLSFTIDPATSLVTAASMSSVDAAFTASAVKVDEDSDRVTVTLTSVADPAVVYKLTVKVAPPAAAGGAPTISAKLKTKKAHKAENENEHDASESGDHDSGSGDHD